MALTLDDVKRIAQLARIEVDEGEAHAVLAQLTKVFALIEQMQAVDTRGVEPMSHALHFEGEGAGQPLRGDEVTECDQHALFHSIAPQVENDLYLVPKVIE